MSSSANELIRRGRNIARKDKKMAYAIFLEATEVSPENAEAWYYLGMVSTKTNEKKQHLEHALKLNPENEKVKNKLRELTDSLSDTKPSLPTHPRQNGQQHSSNNSTSSEITRILGAKIVLDNEFRELVQNIFLRKRSVAPEFGLDVKLLLRIAYTLEQQEKNTERILWGLRFVFSLSAVFLFIVPPLGLIGALIAFGLTIALKLRAMNIFVNRYVKQFDVNNYSEENILQQFKEITDENVLKNIPNDNQNFVAYSRYYPFIGAGEYLKNGWAFPVSLVPDSRDKPIKIFTEQDLYEAIETRLQALNIEGLTIRDYVYARGRDVGHSSEFFDKQAQQPFQRLPTRILQRYAQENSSVARFYKWISISIWQGEIVISFFVRFVITGKILSIEFSPYLLPPIDPSYRDIDNVQSTTFGERLQSIFFDTLIELVVSIPMLIGIIFIPISFVMNLFSRKEKPQENNTKGVFTLKSTRIRDYGAYQSLRERIADKHYNYHHFFQQTDSNVYIRIVEKEIIKTLNQFFIKHNISTTEFGQATQTIVNNVDNSITVEGDATGNFNTSGDQTVEGPVAGVLKASGDFLGGVMGRVNQSSNND